MRRVFPISNEIGCRSNQLHLLFIIQYDLAIQCTKHVLLNKPAILIFILHELSYRIITSLYLVKFRNQNLIKMCSILRSSQAAINRLRQCYLEKYRIVEDNRG